MGTAFWAIALYECIRRSCAERATSGGHDNVVIRICHDPMMAEATDIWRRTLAVVAEQLAELARGVTEGIAA